MRGIGAQPERDLAAQQPVLHRVLVADANLALDLRRPLREISQQPRQQIRPQRGRAGDPQPTRLKSLKASGRMLQTLQQLEDLAGILDPYITGRSGTSALCAALYQLHAERNLEIANVVGNRRLAHVELLCGSRKPSSLHDGDQHLELRQTHHFAEKCYRPPVRPSAHRASQLGDSAWPRRSGARWDCGCWVGRETVTDTLPRGRNGCARDTSSFPTPHTIPVSGGCCG